MEIYVYADWMQLPECQFIGTLHAIQTKGRKAFRFEYDKEWLKTHQNSFILDPDLDFFSGSQYPINKENFGIFLDSMPDRWGRTLMQRKENSLAKVEERRPRTLYDIDFLLGIYDTGRMGALRFKTDRKGAFVNSDSSVPIPSWSSIKDLQYSAVKIESEDNNAAIKEHLALLIAPGSSLGGARPKSNVLDEEGHPWIAKFPSKNDSINKAAWEYLAYQLAQRVGIEMAPCKIEQITRRHHTFFTKRFDRLVDKRIHFTSAMTMTGLDENIIKSNVPSYLDLVDTIENYSSHPTDDLKQLWLRIVFHICISNTDDHLRNHGFILRDEGWRLSPAFDINPSIDKDGLALNINEHDNSLDIELAKSVGEYFRLSPTEMEKIIELVTNTVSNWRLIATRIGISKKEQQLMSSAFIS